MDESLRQAVAVLAVAMIVAIAARQIRLPYTVGLVLVGAVVALSGADFAPHLTHDLIFDLILPPLLFEAALTLSWRELVRDSLPLLALAGHWNGGVRGFRRRVDDHAAGLAFLLGDRVSAR